MIPRGSNFLGVDLAASTSRCSGVARLVATYGGGEVVHATCLGSDEEIVNYARLSRPSVIAIDAPLTRGSGAFRDVDRELIRLGFRVLPISMRWMNVLTERAIGLASKLAVYGFKVIETHPRSALLSSGLRDVALLLKSLNIRLGDEGVLRSKDLRDAVIAAIVAYCYVSNCSRVVRGDEGEVVILKDITQPHYR